MCSIVLVFLFRDQSVHGEKEIEDLVLLDGIGADFGLCLFLPSLHLPLQAQWQSSNRLGCNLAIQQFDPGMASIQLIGS